MCIPQMVLTILGGVKHISRVDIGGHNGQMMGGGK